MSSREDLDGLTEEELDRRHARRRGRPEVERPTPRDRLLADYALTVGDKVDVAVLGDRVPTEGLTVVDATGAALILDRDDLGRVVIPWRAIAVIRTTAPATHPAL